MKLAQGRVVAFFANEEELHGAPIASDHDMYGARVLMVLVQQGESMACSRSGHNHARWDASQHVRH